VLLVRSAPVDLADLTEPRDLTLLVGPEGGWSDRELALATDRAGLGPRNLRADTAAIVGLALALAGRRQL
jgi:16S rRNA (uracil1498-N3)-methyltransferase